MHQTAKRLLLVFLAMVILFTLMLSAQPYEKRINVKGKLVDIKGNPIANAIIKVYRDDILICQTETGEDGIFSFYSKQELVFIKFFARGYEAKESKVDLTAKESVTYWMGEIKLDYAIKILPSGNKFRTKQGEKLEIPVTIVNDGYEKETCFVDINAPLGWQVELVSSEGLHVEGFSITPDTKNTYNLIVHVAKTALGSYNVTLTLRGVFDRKMSIEIIVEKKDWKLLEAKYIDAIALKDSQVLFNFKVINNLGERATIELLTDLPKDWRAEIVDQSNRPFTTVLLEPNEYVEAILKVRVPPQAGYGKETVSLKACGLGVCSTIDFKINVVEGYDDVQFTVTNPFVSAYAGSIAKLKVGIRNEGLSNTVVSLSIEGLPEDYTYTLRDKDGNIISQIFLESGKEEEIEISIPIPIGAEPGFIQFTLKAKGEASEAEAKLGINVLGKYELKILTENFYIETIAGSREKFNVYVKNTGYNAISNLKITVLDTPKNLEVEVEPREIPILMPGENGRFTLIIDVNPETTTGDYFVEFKVESGSVSIMRLLRVSVRQRGEIAYLGLIMVVFIIIILTFLYRKYGRR